MSRPPVMPAEEKVRIVLWVLADADGSAVIVVSPVSCRHNGCCGSAVFSSPRISYHRRRVALHAWQHVRAQAAGLSDSDAYTVVRQVLAEHAFSRPAFGLVYSTAPWPGRSELARPR